jgi:hypothetical protein
MIQPDGRSTDHEKGGLLYHGRHSAGLVNYIGYEIFPIAATSDTYL